MPDSLDHIERLFHEASSLPYGERRAFVETACGGNAALKAEVMSLLEESGTRMDMAAREAVVLHAEVEGAGGGVPERIGAFKVVGVIGEGGMGRVYEAEQESPRRRIAVKVIRPGLVSRSSLRRLVHEAEVLAGLKHPGIAQVYQSGAVGEPGEIGQPYFAMELVCGPTITVFAREKRLGIREKLELLVKVCAAVQHAHQRGVIHRDLKPGNILVEEVGGEATPKVLDFGIARLTGADRSGETFATEAGQLIGTPAYMSPEQIEGDVHGVDTRSDVYALGVIGYELLAGRGPFELSGKPITEVARIVRDVEPPRLGSVEASLRGDVETIIAKAMEKDRERRYASAAELAADIERYLKDEPILARPPTVVYQARKFARRNPALVGGVVAFVALLIASSVVSAVLYARSERERVIAEAARVRAEREIVRQKRITEFLVDDSFAAAMPSRKGHGVRVLDVLDDAAGAVDTRFKDDEELRGRVRQTIGAMYSGTAQLEKARPVLETALKEIDATQGARSSAAIDTVRELGHIAASRGNPKEAERLYREALARCEGATDDVAKVRLDTRLMLGELLQQNGGEVEAEKILREVIAMGPAADAISKDASLNAHLSLAGMLRGQKKDEEAGKLLQEGVEIARRTRASDDPGMLAALNNYSSFLMTHGRAAEAAPLMAEALTGAQRRFPKGHPSLAYLAATTAAAYSGVGKHAEARDAAIKAMGFVRDAFDPGDYKVEQFAPTIENVLEASGDAAGAAEVRAMYYRARLVRMVAKDGEEARFQLKQLLIRYERATGETKGEHPKADAAMEEFVDRMVAAYPEGDVHRSRVLGNLARGVMGLGGPVRGRAGELAAAARKGLGDSRQAGEDREIVEAAEGEVGKE